MNNFLCSLVLLIICSTTSIAQTATFYSTLNGNDYKTIFKDNDGIVVQFKGLKDISSVSKSLYLTAYVGDKDLVMHYKIDHKSEFMKVLTTSSEADGGNQLDLILAPTEAMIVVFKEVQADQSKATVPIMSTLTYVGDPLGIHYRFAMSKLSNLIPVGTSSKIKMQLEDGFINDLGQYETQKVLISGGFTYSMTEAALAELKTKVTAEVKNMIETVADDGVKNDFHKKNIGKIAFAGTPISTSDAAPATKTTFANLTDGVYGRIYLDKSLRNKNAAVAQGHYTQSECAVDVYIDDKYAGRGVYAFSEDINTATSLAYTLVPAKTDKEKYGIGNIYGFAYTLSAIQPGTHKIRVELSSSYKDYPAEKWHNMLLAKGEFSLTFTAAERDAFVKAYTPPPPPPCPRLSKIYIQNNLGVEIKYHVSGCGLSAPGTIWAGKNDHVSSAPVGGTITINGKFFAKIGANDDGRTFNVNSY